MANSALLAHVQKLLAVADSAPVVADACPWPSLPQASRSLLVRTGVDKASEPTDVVSIPNLTTAIPTWLLSHFSRLGKRCDKDSNRRTGRLEAKSFGEDSRHWTGRLRVNESTGISSYRKDRSEIDRCIQIPTPRPATLSAVLHRCTQQRNLVFQYYPFSPLSLPCSYPRLITWYANCTAWQLRCVMRHPPSKRSSPLHVASLLGIAQRNRSLNILTVRGNEEAALHEKHSDLHTAKRRVCTHSR